MKKLIKKFIKDNKLTFKEGTRNSDSVILSGYSLSLQVRDSEIVKQAIDEILPNADANYKEELDRVFSYAKANNYGSWWNTANAEKQYIF